TKPQIGVPVDATVLRGKDRFPFAVRDLSAGGARLVGHDRLVEGERVRIELVLEAGVVAVDATVVRTDPQDAQAAVEFGALPPATSRLIAHEVGRLIERAR